MKMLLAYIIFLMSNPIFGKGLTEHFNMQKFAIDSVQVSADLALNASFQIPPGYQGKTAVALDIYESSGADWKFFKTIEEKDLPMFRTNNKAEFKHSLVGLNPNSDLAFEIKTSFCAKICVINNFQGIAKRSPNNKNKTIAFNLTGYLPMEKIKSEYRPR